MSQPDLSTKQRILGAAELLFAEQGFDGTSLRRVTSTAGVNLAAVNYHFGSKDRLVEEVLRRRLDTLSADRLERLQQLQQHADITLEQLLGAFIAPALDLALDSQGGDAFVRVLARAYAEQDERLRSFLSQNYGQVLKQFAQEFGQLLPHLDKQALYWRLDIVAGALTYVMADFGISKRRDDIDEHQHRQQAERYLVHFAAAGMRDA